MDKKDEKQSVRTPLSVILNMASSEIGSHAIECMDKNGIPPFLMCCVLESVLSNVQKMAISNLSSEYVGLQADKGEDRNGNQHN